MTSYCERGQRIILICRETEKHLNQSQLFKRLGIRIKVVGSSVEGTKIGILDEADCMVLFANLKPYFFRLTKLPTVYKIITEEGRRLLKQFLSGEGNLDYFHFLEEFLNELRQFIRKGAFRGMEVSFTRCRHQVRGDGGFFDQFKHCKDCLPAVTFTKAGPCMIFKDGNTTVSIDLIPLLPCPEKDPIKMFGLVTTGLMQGTLPNWLPYTKKFVKSDVMLPEALSSPIKPKDGCTAMKLLHGESNENVFILRPGQTLAMSNLQEPKLKKAYCYLKALKTLMKADISSYGLKKVLLLEDFASLAGTAWDASELVHLALNHPHLKPVFHGHDFKGRRGRMMQIDYEKWDKHKLEKNTSLLKTHSQNKLTTIDCWSLYSPKNSKYIKTPSFRLDI